LNVGGNCNKAEEKRSPKGEKSGAREGRKVRGYLEDEERRTLVPKESARIGGNNQRGWYKKGETRGGYPKKGATIEKKLKKRRKGGETNRVKKGNKESSGLKVGGRLEADHHRRPVWAVKMGLKLKTEAALETSPLCTDEKCRGRRYC